MKRTRSSAKRGAAPKSDRRSCSAKRDGQDRKSQRRPFKACLSCRDLVARDISPPQISPAFSINSCGECTSQRRPSKACFSCRDFVERDLSPLQISPAYSINRALDLESCMPPRLWDSPNNTTAARGFRPAQFYTRGNTLGGDGKRSGLASIANIVRAEDGFLGVHPVYNPPDDGVPPIAGCSRFSDTCTGYSQREILGLCGRWNTTIERCLGLDPSSKPGESNAGLPKSASDLPLRQKPSRSAPPPPPPPPPPLPPPPPCICPKWVETVPATTEAFTMTEKCTRSLGTEPDLKMVTKAAWTENVTRDVFTDTDDPFEDEFMLI